MPSLDRRFSLDGRVALVTGGSRGLGRAMALGFAAAGADVVVASRSIETCEGVAAEVVALGRRALPHAVRMQHPAEVEALVAAAVSHFGRLDVVVNNAGTVLDRPLGRIEADTFHGAFATNLLGPLTLVQAAADHLADSGHGSVVNIVSIAMGRAAPGRYYYPPVKAALAQVTKSLAVDLGPRGIRVNAISPGTFRTDMVTKAYDDETLEHIGRGTALGRIAEPDEIVGPALLLASDAGSFVTGEVLTVDGGATA